MQSDKACFPWLAVHLQKRRSPATAILASFAYYKVNVMLEYQRIYLQEPTEVHYFDNDFSFDSSYGWEVAFGLTKYDYKDPMIQPDASYG